jgi:hypothetical protein
MTAIFRRLSSGRVRRELLPNREQWHRRKIVSRAFVAPDPPSATWFGDQTHPNVAPLPQVTRWAFVAQQPLEPNVIRGHQPDYQSIHGD